MRTEGGAYEAGATFRRPHFVPSFIERLTISSSAASAASPLQRVVRQRLRPGPTRRAEAIRTGARVRSLAPPPDEPTLPETGDVRNVRDDEARGRTWCSRPAPRVRGARRPTLRNDFAMRRAPREAAIPRGKTRITAEKTAFDSSAELPDTSRFSDALSNDIKLSGERSESAAARG